MNKVHIIKVSLEQFTRTRCASRVWERHVWHRVVLDAIDNIDDLGSSELYWKAFYGRRVGTCVTHSLLTRSTTLSL